MRKISLTWRKIVVLLLVLVSGYLVMCVVTVFRVRAFRKHPQSAVAFDLFQGSLPHKLIGRALLFKRGSGDYNSDITRWAFRSGLIADNPWNRWMLEGAVTNLTEDTRTELLPAYPLTPTRGLIPLLRQMLQAGRYRVLPLLSRGDSEECREVARDWIQKNVLDPANARLFVAASGFLAQSDALPFPEVIKVFWPKLRPAQQKRVLARVASRRPSTPGIASVLFGWFDSSLSRGQIPRGCEATALLGRFLSIPSLRAQAIEVIGREWRNLLPSQVDVLFHFVKDDERAQVARAVIEKTKATQAINPLTVVRIFDLVASEDIATAEQMAQPFLAERDSEVRKGIIVTLIKGGSIKATAMIDDSFKGNAPRTTLFNTIDAYAYGSEAADLYRALSTHDYVETGKTWPPTYLRSGPTPAEVSGWRRFIDVYPWFPGTDDAYYRLAFSQFAQKNYVGSISTIREYLGRAYWPDNDARPFLLHLLRSVLLASDASVPDMPYAIHLRNIAANPLAPMIYGSRERLPSVIDSIKWFLSHPKTLVFINTDQPTMRTMLDLAETIRDSSSDSVCRLVAAKLEMGHSDGSGLAGYEERSSTYEDEPDAGDETDEDTDDVIDEGSCREDELEERDTYRASIVQSVLYGIFDSLPQPKPPALGTYVQTDPAERALAQMARSLNDQFSKRSLQEVRSGSLDELITLALLHSGSEFDRWKDEFKPTMQFLVAVNNRDVPDIVSGRHIEMCRRLGASQANETRGAPIVRTDPGARARGLPNRKILGN
jgi:hypothetical protein